MSENNNSEFIKGFLAGAACVGLPVVLYKLLSSSSSSNQITATEAPSQTTKSTPTTTTQTAVKKPSTTTVSPAKQQQQQQTKKPTTSATTTTVSTSSWKSFENEIVKFNYPQDWTVEEMLNPVNQTPVVAIGLPNDLNTKILFAFEPAVPVPISEYLLLPYKMMEQQSGQVGAVTVLDERDITVANKNYDAAIVELVVVDLKILLFGIRSTEILCALQLLYPTTANSPYAYNDLKNIVEAIAQSTVLTVPQFSA
jgi:hypothetical protein